MPTTEPTSAPQLEQAGEDVYNALMGGIEPDLLTFNLPLLEEKYKNETSEQRASRYRHYEEAYAAYDKMFEEWNAQYQEKVKARKRQALASAEAKNREEEQPLLADIEAKMTAIS